MTQDLIDNGAEPGVMTVEQVPLENLHLDPRNARKGDVASIIDSLREFGQHRAVVARRSDGRIIAGNHLYKAAEVLGWPTLGVTYVDDDDEKAIRRGIADNSTGDKAKWDDAMLVELLKEVGTDIPGLDSDAWNKKMSKAIGEGPETPVYPIVAKPGEHYSYVLVVATSTIDSAWMESAFELERQESYKSSAVGVSRVVTVDKLRKLLPAMTQQASVGDE